MIFDVTHMMGRVEKYNFFFSFFRSVSLKHTVLKAKNLNGNISEEGSYNHREKTERNKNMRFNGHMT